MPMGIPTSVGIPCHQIAHIRGKKNLHITQCKSNLYTSHISCRRNIPPFPGASMYVFDSLLKQHLTRDNTLLLIRSCGKDVYKVDTSNTDT